MAVLRRALSALVWVAIYALAVVWFTWPLGAHLTTHLPNVKAACRFDAPLQIWALAHESDALVTDWRAFPHAPAFYPTRHALYYGEASFGALPLYLPTFLVSRNPTLAANVMLLSAIALTAATLHLVTQRWTGSAAAGLVAAASLLASRWLLWEWPPCAPNYAVLFYFPLVVALAAAPPSRLRFVALAVLTALQGAVTAYLLVAIVAPLAVLGGVRVVRRSTRRDGLQLLAATAASLALVAPLYAGYVTVRLGNPAIAQQTLWRQESFVPMRLPSGLFGYLSPMAIAYVALALIAIGAWLRATSASVPATSRGWRVAALFAIVGLVMSLPPEMVWSGRRIHLPYAGLEPWLTFYRVVRVPMRLGIASLIGLCLLAGLAFAQCARSLPRLPAYLAASLLALMMFAERRAAFDPFGAGIGRSFASYPIAPAPALDPQIATALAAGRGPVLELPAGFQGAPWPAWQVGAMFHAIAHRRPVLNGYSGYWPADFPARMRLAEALPDSASLATLRRQTGVTDVVVRLADLDADARGRWEQLAARGGGDGLRLKTRTPHTLLFEVDGATEHQHARRH